MKKLWIVSLRQEDGCCSAAPLQTHHKPTSFDAFIHWWPTAALACRIQKGSRSRSSDPLEPFQMSAADGNGADVYGTKLRKSAGDW